MAKRSIESSVATIILVGGLLFILYLLFKSGALDEFLKGVKKILLFDFLTSSTTVRKTEHDETVDEERSDAGDESGDTNPAGGGSGSNEEDDAPPADKDKVPNPYGSDEPPKGTPEWVWWAIFGGAGATAIALALSNKKKSNAPKSGQDYGGYGSGSDPSSGGGIYGVGTPQRTDVKTSAYEDLILKAKTGKDYTVKLDQSIPNYGIPTTLREVASSIPKTSPTPTTTTPTSELPSTKQLEEATRIKSPIPQPEEFFKPITDIFGNVLGFIAGIPQPTSIFGQPIMPIGIPFIPAPIPIPVVI